MRYLLFAFACLLCFNFSVFFSPHIALAEQKCDISSGVKSGFDCLTQGVAGNGGIVTSSDPTGQTTFVVIITRIITFLLGITGILALLALIIGGLSYITSFGNEVKAERAKKIALYAVIGLLVTGLSFALLSIIELLLKGSP